MLDAIRKLIAELPVSIAGPNFRLCTYTGGNVGGATWRLDDDEKGTHLVRTPGGAQQLIISTPMMTKRVSGLWTPLAAPSN